MSVAKWFANHVPVIQMPMLKGWAGFATPFAIFVNDRLNTRLVMHEQAHVYQWWRGWLLGFMWEYAVALYRHGYYNNPFEVLARKHSRAEIQIEQTWPEV